MLIPSRAYLDFREAFRRGDGEVVLGTGQPVLDQLGADERQAGLVPAVLLMVGATLARLERFADATAYLERGLQLLPGTEATREVGDGDWYALLLLDLLMATGRFRDAWGRIQALIEPDRDAATRLGATRAQVALYAAFGDFETAQQLLNTAAGLADRVGSHQLAAMVDGDRAIVLAAQGRTVEAAVFADQVLPQLGRPGAGPLTPLVGCRRRHGDDHRGPPRCSRRGPHDGGAHALPRSGAGRGDRAVVRCRPAAAGSGGGVARRRTLGRRRGTAARGPSRLPRARLRAGRGPGAT